ncbi:MAG: nitrilotriacetate monooxygenase [Alphaproteobacteria bacterium]|nr:MAG: nitrilotriacetate monooxygenase [Alphaproteobacteria bacterium]
MTDGSMSRDLRQALARFVTGVAVVTAAGPDGSPLGLTVNSFGSVSLEPPLVLWSLSCRSSQREQFVAASHFAINVLGAAQQDVSARFAGPRDDRFDGIDWQVGLGGAPLLDGCIASFECAAAGSLPAGDHVILFGRVERFRHGPGAPLVFFASRYGLSREAA